MDPADGDAHYSDTDGDGLSDGEEMACIGTNNNRCG